MLSAPSDHRNARASDERSLKYQCRDGVAIMCDPAKYVEYIPIPIVLQEWANGKEIQSILFKVNLQLLLLTLPQS